MGYKKRAAPWSYFSSLVVWPPLCQYVQAEKELATRSEKQDKYIALSSFLDLVSNKDLQQKGGSYYIYKLNKGKIFRNNLCVLKVYAVHYLLFA